MDIIKHYNNLASNFNEYWNYSDDFVNAVTTDIISIMEIDNNDNFVDIGCGTGIYSLSILKKVNFTKPMICVDVSPEMLKQIPENKSVVKVNLDVIEYAATEFLGNKILNKEILHHISYQSFLNNIADRMKSGIVLSIISSTIVEYPLFEKAKVIRENCNPIEHKIEDLFVKKSFVTEIINKSYKIELEKERYFNMLSKRYMSFLNKLTDEEIETGIKELRIRYSNVTNLTFNENFIFIKAQKYEN